MMNKQTTIEAAINAPETLYGALVAAQAEMKAPHKDREVTVKMTTGGSYKFSYATMAAMVEAARPVLTKHGLWFIQFIENGAMVTRIIHETGYVDCPIPMPNLPNKPQEAGSIITYFKRYSFAAAFGQVADEEDDANIAEGNDYTPREVKAAPVRMATDDQVAGITQLCRAAGKTIQDIVEAHKVSSLPELTEAKAASTIKRLQELARETVDA